MLLKTEEEDILLLDYMNLVCSRKTVPFIHCIGNHDLFFDRLDGTFGDRILSDRSGAVKTEKREVRIFRLGAGGFYFHCGAKF